MIRSQGVPERYSLVQKDRRAVWDEPQVFEDELLPAHASNKQDDVMIANNFEYFIIIFLFIINNATDFHFLE